MSPWAARGGAVDDLYAADDIRKSRRTARRL